MSKIYLFLSGLCVLALVSCSAVKVSATNQYQLTAFSAKHFGKKAGNITLLVTPPEAVSGYQTEQMLYVNKPFKVEAFAENVWASAPADMLYPLMVQSLQRTGVFYAVSSNTYSQESDYRLDTQLLTLEQNFLKKPSVLEFSVKVVLTHIGDNKVMASRIINLQIPCPSDTPYGGVLAANKATLQFTAILADFVASHIRNRHN